MSPAAQAFLCYASASWMWGVDGCVCVVVVGGWVGVWGGGGTEGTSSGWPAARGRCSGMAGKGELPAVRLGPC